MHSAHLLWSVINNRPKDFRPRHFKQSSLFEKAMLNTPLSNARFVRRHNDGLVEEHPRDRVINGLWVTRKPPDRLRPEYRPASLSRIWRLHLEEMMAERGISVDHSTVHRRAIKVLPVLEKEFRHHKRAVGRSWRMDETYSKVQGQWKICIVRSTSRATRSIACLRAHRDKVAAQRYFEKSIDQNGEPEMVTIR
jgi:DDE domain